MFGFDDLYGGGGDFWSPDDQIDLGAPAPLTPKPFRQPPPRRLTADELRVFLDKGMAPTRPAPLTSVSQLQGDDLKQARMGSLWAGLAALGTGVSGHWDRATAEGLPAIQGAQDRVLAGANARQDAGYEASLVDFKARQEHQQQKAVQGGLMGFYNKIADAEPPDSPFTAHAELLARAGDMAGLERAAQQVPYRQFARSKGADPDAWDTQQKLQGDLAAAIEAAKMRATNPLKTEQAAAEAKAVQDARLPGEKELKLAPSYQAPPQYEPLSRVAARTELVQGIEDKHAQLRAAAKQGTSIPGRLAEMPDKSWAWISPPTADNPKPSITPVDGQPTKAGGLSHFMKDGQPYVWNPSKAEMGAIPVAVHEAGEAGAPSIKDLTAAPPRVPSPGQGGQGPPGRPTAAPAPAPVGAPEASRKLGAVADPAVQKRIGAARAAGYSDSEIASFLGIH